MKFPVLLRTVQPFIAAAAVIATTSVLMVAIYFTLLDLEWIAFLAGILFAAILAMVSRATRAEYAATSIIAKLGVAEEELGQKRLEHQQLKVMLDRANARLKYTDEGLVAMLACVDAEGIYRYHNQAFRRWVDLADHQIDGHPMRNVLGKVAYAQIEPDVQRAFAGETVRYERTQKMADGRVYRLSVQLFPVQGALGRTSGFFVVMADITERRNVQSLIGAPPETTTDGAAGAPVAATPESAATQDEQSRFNESVAAQVTGLVDIRERIAAAIERNEFTLYRQHIVPLAPASGNPHHYEIFTRLIEEEDKLIPPGAFFPLAEEMGLLPVLDRWVVTNVLKWLAGSKPDPAGPPRGACFINVASATLCDPDFPDFLEQQLRKTGVAAARLCFEVFEPDLKRDRRDAESFLHAVKALGCRIALAGFGRDRIALETLKSLPLDFLKFDGSVVLQVCKDPVAQGKVVAMNRIARAIGIETIAEMVEDDKTESRLRHAAVDFAQGFGISSPEPLPPQAD